MQLFGGVSMALRDPVAVYKAATAVEAHIVKTALSASGVEAHVTEVVSEEETWFGGPVPDIHRPQVWIERTDMDRAKPVLDEFQRRSGALQEAGAEGGAPGPVIEVDCEECGQRSAFPAVQRGSVQQCHHCGAYVDVETETSSEESAESQGDEEVAGES
jgi:hypothetical protein